jgi:hypothetical protein
MWHHYCLIKTNAIAEEVVYALQRKETYGGWAVGGMGGRAGNRAKRLRPSGCGGRNYTLLAAYHLFVERA